MSDANNESLDKIRAKMGFAPLAATDASFTWASAAGLAKSVSHITIGGAPLFHNVQVRTVAPGRAVCTVGVEPIYIDCLSMSLDDIRIALREAVRSIVPVGTVCDLKLRIEKKQVLCTIVLGAK